jgi:hypothetical protein
VDFLPLSSLVNKITFPVYFFLINGVKLNLTMHKAASVFSESSPSLSNT